MLPVLMQHDMNLWFPRSVDSQGGFHESHDLASQPTRKDYRAKVFQARLTWTAATLAEYFPEHCDRFVGDALHGMGYLRDHLADDKHEGYF